MTVDDLATLREVVSLTVSPDGHRYAILVRQPDPVSNTYRTGWFVGGTKGGPLVPVGAGGQADFLVQPNGSVSGDLDRPEGRWSPDGRWIAYALRRNGEVQLWRSKADGSLQEQVTRNPSDVLGFAWSAGGQALYFTAGTPRSVLLAEHERKQRTGFRYNEDLLSFLDLMKPTRSAPDRNPAAWIVDLDDRRERLADEAERAAFTRALAHPSVGAEPVAGFAERSAVSPVARQDGAVAWLKRAEGSQELTVMLSPSATSTAAIACPAAPCSGAITKLWWSEDGLQAYFTRREGIGNVPGHSLYSWAPPAGTVSVVAQWPDDFIWSHEPAAGNVLIAVHESLAYPRRVVAVDLGSGQVKELADVNPELRNVRIGKVERFEWDVPPFAWNEKGGPLEDVYPRRAQGYILYPPDFDPRKTYPAFIDPYAIFGFSSSVGHEHPLQAYAANGIVVLTMAFPFPTGFARLGPSAQGQLYASELDYPHLSIRLASTVAGLDAALARGFIDPRRVGIGGVSNGTFIPLYMLQKHDRIAAISVSAGSWGPEEYYWPTRKGRSSLPGTDWRVKPVGAGREYWSRIDIADHVDAIEAPIIMHHSLAETRLALRFMRHLDDDGKPYDAYIFTDETHVKWQPAHLQAIKSRNLDWFRFWLQDHEDAVPEKQEQYQRWHELRELQCKNPRSVRDYCSGGQ